MLRESIAIFISVAVHIAGLGGLLVAGTWIAERFDAPTPPKTPVVRFDLVDAPGEVTAGTRQALAADEHESLTGGQTVDSIPRSRAKNLRAKEPGPVRRTAPRKATKTQPPAPPAEPAPVETPPVKPRTEPSTTTTNAHGPTLSPPPPSDTLPISENAQAELEHQITRWIQNTRTDPDRQALTTWTHEGTAYHATLSRRPSSHPMGIEEAVITVRTTRKGRGWTTKMRMKRLAFSHFAQFVDRWDPKVLMHDDEIDGRFHSNSAIPILHRGGVRPTFQGKVTTARTIQSPSSSWPIPHDKVFAGGLETRVRKILLPDRFDRLFGSTRAGPATKRIHEFSSETHIEFRSDGSYLCRNANGREAPEQHALSDEPHYLLGAGAWLGVRGTVRGKVLVYSSRGILVDGNLTFARDPATHPESADYLGLVSERNIEVAGPGRTGPGDLTIHAALYAKRRFVVRDHRFGKSSKLEILGSVTAGSLGATEPRFRTELTFDRRLENLRPPSFPVTDRYEIVDRDGQWTADPSQPP